MARRHRRHARRHSYHRRRSVRRSKRGVSSIAAKAQHLFAHPVTKIIAPMVGGIGIGQFFLQPDASGRSVLVDTTQLVQAAALGQSNIPEIGADLIDRAWSGLTFAAPTLIGAAAAAWVGRKFKL